MTPRLAIYRLIGIVVVGVSCGSCTFMNTITGQKARSEQMKTQETELQQKVMRFADEFVSSMGRGVNLFQESGVTPEMRLEGQRWSVNQATAAIQIASGSSAVVDATDMVVLVTLSRMVIEDTWMVTYGKEARPILDAYVTLEPVAWALVDGVLTPEQQAELRNLIAQWRVENPKTQAVSFVRLADFAKSKARRSDATGGTGLFGLLGLDPLAGLDPAVREVEQTRLLAERAVYYMQHMPALLNAQAELLADELAVMPESRELLAATTQVGNAAESMAATAAGLPDWATRERQATIDQFMRALQSQEESMRALLVELREALQAGTATSDSVNTTVRSLDSFIGSFDSPEPTSASAQPSPPFDINDYTRAAAAFTQTARELQVLVASLDQNVTPVTAAALRVTDSGRGLVDYAFRRGLILIGALILGILLAAVAYRSFSIRFNQRSSSHT